MTYIDGGGRTRCDVCDAIVIGDDEQPAEPRCRHTAAYDAGKAAFEAHKRASERVRSLQDELSEAEEYLSELAAELEELRQECGHCNDCSACLG